MSDDLVEIDVFPIVPLAEIARNRLIAMGIPAFVDTSAKMGSYLGNFIGGVRLMVRESDAERAIELLEASHPLREDDSLAVDSPRAPATEESEADLPPLSHAGERLADARDIDFIDPVEDESRRDTSSQISDPAYVIFVFCAIAMAMGIAMLAMRKA